MQLLEWIVIYRMFWLQDLIIDFCLEVFDAIILLPSFESITPYIAIDDTKNLLLFRVSYEVLYILEALYLLDIPQQHN